MNELTVHQNVNKFKILFLLHCGLVKHNLSQEAVRGNSVGHSRRHQVGRCVPVNWLPRVSPLMCRNNPWTCSRGVPQVLQLLSSPPSSSPSFTIPVSVSLLCPPSYHTHTHSRISSRSLFSFLYFQCFIITKFCCTVWLYQAQVARKAFVPKHLSLRNKVQSVSRFFSGKSFVHLNLHRNSCKMKYVILHYNE